MSDYHAIIADVEFQNRFGMHTKPFQELAANLILLTRGYTDASVREVGDHVKNLMQEKHKPESDLAESTSEISASGRALDAAHQALAAANRHAKNQKPQLGIIEKSRAKMQDTLIEALSRAESAEARLRDMQRDLDRCQTDKDTIEVERDVAIRAAADRMVELAKERDRLQELVNKDECREMQKLPEWSAGCSLANICIDACREADRARRLFPKPDHLTLALAEEAGEITKAVLDFHNGKGVMADVRKEIVQTMAMCIRLATEGDPTLNLPATA